MSDWQLQDVKNRFSEVVKRAGDEGPQTVTVHGRRTAVVMSAREYDRLVKPRMDFNNFLLSSPEWPDSVIDIVNDRSKDPGRDIAFRCTSSIPA